MIQRNNNLSVLPFYTSIEEQAHRRSYAYGDKFPLYTPLGQVPPFQIIRPHSSATFSAAMLYTAEGEAFRVITTDMSDNGLSIQMYVADGYDIIRFSPLYATGITTREGQYYMTIRTSDGTVYYSDVFTVVGDMSGYVHLQWWDLQDFVMDGCRIAYNNVYGQQNFRNTLWLQTQIGKPDYEFDEQGEQRDGLFFAEKMLSWKKYRMTILASEYLCDVMRFIRLSDLVFIRDQFGNKYRCDTFLITPKWEVQGNLASIEIEFTCDTVAKKIAHGYDGYGDHGDFNDDYNSDFDIDETT